MKNLEIYIHIPFCVKKCAYCDFLSAPASMEAQRQYLLALLQEIRRSANGTVEVRLADRLKAIELLTALLAQDQTGAEQFFASLEQAGKAL